MSRNPQAILGSTPLVGPEAELVQGLRSRSPDAWSELYNSYYERLRKYAIGRLGSRDDAEDLVSLAFLRALHRIDSYRSNGKPILAWLYGILQNLLRENGRKRPLHPTHPIAESDGIPDLRHEDPDLPQLMDLEAALTLLTNKQREVITLLHFGGFNVKEVASILGKNERSVYYLETRALLRLRTALKSEGDE